MKLKIRPEAPDDHSGIRAVNLAAFETPVEADLVDKIRKSCPSAISLVALDQSRVVGHILFTPAVLETGKDPLTGMALGPMSVLPEFQKKGVGSALVELGIALLRRRECPFVVVLGHPTYYPRFGFMPAAGHHIDCQWPGVPSEAFMVLILDEKRMAAVRGGVARYLPEFDTT